MALITDPDLLNQGTEIVFDTTNKTIQLLAAGNLSNDGVTLQTVYSCIKEEWKNDDALIQYDFPMVPITSEQFELVNGWTFADAATINLLRSGGFAVKDASGVSLEEYIGLITLGSIGAADQVYYQQTIGGAPTDIVLTGAVNQCVKVYGDATHGAFDYRDYLQVFVREQAKTYDNATHTDIGVSSLTYQVYRFPLTNAADLKITHDDTTVDAYGVTATYYATAQQRTIGGTAYNFDVIVDGNNRTAEEIYEAVQSLLRKNSDIDSGTGTVTGKTADSLMHFVGDTLVTSTGVYIDNFQATDTNRIEFFDTSGTKRTFPYVAAGAIEFNANLTNDASAIYKMFYSDNFGTALAELVLDSSGAAIEGPVAGATQVTFDYDYDSETSGGGAGIDKNITVVAIGAATAQHVKATGVISRSTENSITLVSSLERTYSNPV
jgi:hypothetical protein